MHFSTLFSYCPVCGSKHFIINNEKSKRCEDCGFVLYINASAAVAAFIRNPNGDLLVTIRGKEPAKGTWDLPGGFVDNNETAEEALKRELTEELNATTLTTDYLFSLPNEYEYSGLTVPTLDLFFACRLADTSHLTPSDDVEKLFFVPLSAISVEKFGLKSIRKAVQRFLSADSFPENN